MVTHQALCQEEVIRAEEEEEDEEAGSVAWTSVVPIPRQTERHQATTSAPLSTQVGATRRGEGGKRQELLMTTADDFGFS